MSAIPAFASQPTAVTSASATAGQPPHPPFTLPPPSPAAKKSKSLRPLFDNLAHAGHQLDDILQDLDLSKEETESLLASQNFHTHRQLRTQLLAQQLQLAAQDHAQFALHRLLDLSNSNHPAIARLAATQILAYAGLTPPTPYTPPLAGGTLSNPEALAQFPHHPPPAPSPPIEAVGPPRASSPHSAFTIPHSAFTTPILLALLLSSSPPV